MWTDPADRHIVETDLMVALALGRAATNALLNLSQLSHREMCEALRHELKALEADGDSRAISASAQLRRMLPKAEAL
jgi:hypothetical protein